MEESGEGGRGFSIDWVEVGGVDNGTKEPAVGVDGGDDDNPRG